VPGGGPLNLLVDASSLIYRASFAIPDSIRARDGSPVNAAYGFCEMLARLIGDLRPRWVACCLDADWRPEWRVDLLESYKAHRVGAEGEPENPVEAQIPVVERVLRLLGIAAVGAPGCEAEDVIATLLRRVRGRTAIVSGTATCSSSCATRPSGSCTRGGGSPTSPAPRPGEVPGLRLPVLPTLLHAMTTFA
jgi:5'-3' exonuclease